MPHSMMTEPSQQQSTQNKKLIPSRLDLSFTAVPYSQTYESKPPILMVPPRNPLRNAKPSPDAAAAAAAPAGATASPSPVSGDAGDAPYSIAGLHSVFSPLGLRQPSTSSTSPGPPEAERWDDVLQLSGYWDELDEFTEPPSHGDLDLKLTDHVSGSGPGSGSGSGAAGGAKEADKSALPPPPKSPEPPQAQAQAQPPESQPTESVTGEHPRRKRHFWSQIRRARKSVSTISSEPESVPPLSPAHPERKSRQRSSIAESESSGCSMHTPTSAECPNDVSDRLLSLHQVLATGPPGPEKKKTSDRRENPERPCSRKADETGSAVTKTHPALPSLVPQHKPLPAGELPHTLTVVIPEGRLFEDDFLDSLSF